MRGSQVFFFLIKGQRASISGFVGQEARLRILFTWTEVRDIVQETGIKTILEKKMQKTKWLSEEALQIAVKEEKQKAKEKRKDKSI